jgi:dienelactone hydrolase
MLNLNNPIKCVKIVNEMKKLNVKNIFVAGYCFGGTAAIEYARTGNPFNGVITFHGGLSASADDAKLKYLF